LQFSPVASTLQNVLILTYSQYQTLYNSDYKYQLIFVANSGTSTMKDDFHAFCLILFCLYHRPSTYTII